MNIKELKRLFEESKIKWSTHCLERMQERDISRVDVKNCISHGEIIEDYPEDYPHPSCLIFGYAVNGKVIHVVAGMGIDTIYIITVYYANTVKFEEDLKTRKES